MRNALAPATPVESLRTLDSLIRIEFDSLLAEAQPSRARAHQLMNLLKWERPDVSSDRLSAQIERFYRAARHKRDPAMFSRVFEVEYYPWLHEHFSLQWSHAEIPETRVARAASNLSFRIRGAISAPAELSTAGFIQGVINRIIRCGGPDEVDLWFFTEMWSAQCWKRWGDRHEAFFLELAGLMNEQLVEVEASRIKNDTDLVPFIPNFTQTDLDWLTAILIAHETGFALPDHPSSRGPTIPETKEIEKLVRLRNSLRSQPLPDMPTLERLDFTIYTKCLHYICLYQR